MRDAAAYLIVWLTVLFGLVGVVLAAVARLVRKDTTEHDRRFLWHIYGREDNEKKGEE